MVEVSAGLVEGQLVYARVAGFNGVLRDVGNAVQGDGQFQAMQMAFFTFLPQILLSGFMFPYAGMPKAAQWFAEILPLTHFLRLVRAIMLRGAAVAEMWTSLAALGVMIAVMLGVAVSRVHKRLD